MKRINKLTLSALALPVAVVPAITTSCNKQQVTTFEIDSQGLVTLKDKSLTSVTIPSTIDDIEVHGIATNGFKDTKVESVSFAKPSLITRIDNYAFAGCSNLKSFIVPKNVTYLGIAAFSGCTSLETCSFENDCLLQTLQERTFENTKMYGIDIPASVMNISKGVFAYSGSSPLTKVNFANTTGWKQGTEPIDPADMKPDKCADNFKKLKEGVTNNWGFTGIKRSGKTVPVKYDDSTLSSYFHEASDPKPYITEGEDNLITFGLMTKAENLNGEYLIWVNTNEGRLLKETIYKVEHDKTTKCAFVIDNWTYVDANGLVIKATKKK